jgi:general secretion pathway protein A
MDFLNFFGLKEDPFKLTPDPAYFYPSSSHNEGLLLMDYSIEQKEGFLLLVGDPGTGKTTLLNVFLDKWRSKAEIAIILTPRLSPEEFLISVIEDLSIHLENKNKNEIIKALRDFMIKKSLKGRRVIIVVDEAQNLPDETLEELRLLSNLETAKEKLLQIILIGQPELESKLMRDKLRQLNQRITTRIHLQPFTLEETLDYINCRLIKAGRRNLKIHRKAGKLTHKLSKGVPRLINMIISRALMAAYLEESNTIHHRHIYHAVKSLSHGDIKIQKWNRWAPASIGLSLILLIGVAGYIYLQYTEYPKAEKLVKISKPIQETPEEITAEEKKIDNKEEPMIEEKQTPAFKLISVKVDIANIREMPSLTSKKVGRSLRGNQFVALQESLDNKNTKWYQIPYKGRKYWISEEVVDIIDLPE